MAGLFRNLGLILLTLLAALSLYVGAKEGAFDFRPVSAISPTLREEEAALEKTLPPVEVNLEGRIVTLRSGAERLKTATAEERQFVHAYLAALRSHDIVAVKKLVHPASLQCLGERDARFLPFRLNEETARQAPAPYYLYMQEEEQQLTGESKLLAERFYADPVPPTHSLVIAPSVASGEYPPIVQKLAVLPEGKDAGQFRLVLGCPTAETIAGFRSQQAEKQQLQADVQLAYERLNESLKSALADRMKNHSLQQAVQECIARCGVEPSVAYALVLRIKQERGL